MSKQTKRSRAGTAGAAPQPAEGATVPKVGEPDNRIEIHVEPGVDEKALMARTILRPTVKAAVAATWFSKSIAGQSGSDITSLVSELSNQSKAVIAGDMTRPESMLVAQAHTLDAIFLEMSRRAALNMGEYIDAADTYMRLALKAQSQCRATLETLATIKNPPQAVSFVKQANIAHGPQQVNNGTTPVATRAGNSEIQQSKLLETANGERLDFGATKARGSADPSMETVGAFNGTAVQKG